MKHFRPFAFLGLALFLMGAQAQEITFAGWSAEEPASHDVIFGMIDGFEKANPEVEVDWVGFPWSEVQQNYILRYRSNEAPQLAQLQERWLSTFASLDALVDLNEVFGQEYLESKMDPGLLSFGQFGGKQLGIPWTAASIGMVANTKVLSDAGISDLPTTVEEFVQALEAVKAANPNAVPYALSTKNNASINPDFQIWLWTFGGSLYDEQGNVTVNSPEGLATLAFLKDLVDRGLAAKDIDRPDARRLFAQNESAFYFDAPLARGFARDNSGEGETFDANVAAMATPVLDEANNPQSISWGHLLIMFKQDENVTADSAQAELLEYLSFDPEPQLNYFQTVGLFPVSREALADPSVEADEYVSTWSANASFARREENSAYANAGELTDVVGEEVQAVLLGQKGAEQALKDMETRLKRLLDVR